MLLSLYLCFYVIVSFGESKKSYGAKSGEFGGCKMIVIFLVQNPILGFTVQVIFATFAADAEGCHCSNVGLQFVFVEKLYNAQVHEC